MQNIEIGKAYLASIPGLTDASGNLANANALPSIVVLHNGVPDTTAGFSAVHAATGLYDVSGTVPATDSSAAPYNVGDKCSVHWTATMPDGTSVGGTLETFQVGLPHVQGMQTITDTTNLVLNGTFKNSPISATFPKLGTYQGEPYFGAAVGNNPTIVYFDGAIWILGDGTYDPSIPPMQQGTSATLIGTYVGFITNLTTAYPSSIAVAPSDASIQADAAAAIAAAFPNAPKVDLVDAPNATAVTAIQAGLSKPGTEQTITAPYSLAQIAAALWQDATAGDFTVTGSAGKKLFALLEAASYTVPPTVNQIQNGLATSTQVGSPMQSTDARLPTTVIAAKADVEAVPAAVAALFGPTLRTLGLAQYLTGNSGSLIFTEDALSLATATFSDADLQQLAADLLALIGSKGINVVVASPILPNMNLELVPGDAYDSTTAQQIVFTDSGAWPTLTAANTEVKCAVANLGDPSEAIFTFDCTVAAGPPQTVTDAFTAENTAKLVPGAAYLYQIRAIIGGANTEIRTLVGGQISAQNAVNITW